MKLFIPALLAITVCALLALATINPLFANPGPEGALAYLPEASSLHVSDGRASESADPPLEAEAGFSSSAHEASAYLPDYDPPEQPLDPEQMAVAYFETLYDAYIEMEDDETLPQLLDMGVRHNHNFLRWISMMNQRRRLIFEYDFCYVETEKLPFTITFLPEEELEDDRIQNWMSMGANGVGTDDENERLLHFEITGERDRAYPPFMAVNSQHTMRFRFDGERWRIVWHYYPGAIRAFRSPNLEINPLSDEEMLSLLEEEFAEPTALPVGSGGYDGEAAAVYALMYAEEGNPDFYRIDDWMGNCMNFISQCVWAGLHGGGEYIAGSGRYMDGVWYSGGGGGSPAWENVEHFWNYAVSGFRSLFPKNIRSLTAGDLLQTRTLGLTEAEEDRFNHCLMLVDEETLMLAQNSPATFVYYSDLVNTEFRFLRPVGK